MHLLPLLLTLIACFGAPEEVAERRPTARRPRAPHPPHVVLFMVLDTVRADHTSLCGYGRPTTPALQALARAGASYTCDAYSPAPWTLPSHASYFTGKSVTEHATMFVTNSDVSVNATITARPLAESFETLAETYKARGYQTAILSGNSILNPATGLLQGFDHKNISTNGFTLRGHGMGIAIEQLLQVVDPEKPLFLMVNAYDAHDPYPAIPAQLEWAPPQPRVKLDAYTKEPTNPYFSFIKGLMPEAERPAFLQRLTDGYDYGVLHADGVVTLVMGALNRGGWFQNGYRVVITSDHGEFLGEHGLLRHCGFVWEPVVRVPVVYLDSFRRKVEFPTPLSAIHVYDLVKDGHLPKQLLAPQTVSEKNPDDILVGTIAGAVWGAAGRKATCVEGATALHDLIADPTEANPQPLGDSALAAELTSLCAGIDHLHTLPVPQVDASVAAALKAMGYAEDDGDEAAAPPPPRPGRVP